MAHPSDTLFGLLPQRIVEFVLDWIWPPPPRTPAAPPRRSRTQPMPPLRHRAPRASPYAVVSSTEHEDLRSNGNTDDRAAPPPSSQLRSCLLASPGWESTGQARHQIRLFMTHAVVFYPVPKTAGASPPSTLVPHRRGPRHFRRPNQPPPVSLLRFIHVHTIRNQRPRLDHV